MTLFRDFQNPQAIDASVRAQLADSLAYVFSQAESHLAVDRERFYSAVEQIRLRKQHPGVFARYFHLISAVNANQFSNAHTLLEELIDRASEPVSFQIVAFTKEEIGSDYERFPELLFAEFSNVNPMASPSQSQFETATRNFREAIAIISQVDKRIDDEIKTFLARIYLAVVNSDPSSKPFGGVTSVMAWGATFVNIEAYQTRWDAMQFLVHEITHSLLFGLSSDQPLVLNLAEESYPSPLRADPRPMDGIFHATLVCARLAAFNQAWVNSGLAETDDRDRSKNAVVRNSQLFHDGLAVIKQHGNLSELGHRLVDHSRQGVSELALE